MFEPEELCPDPRIATGHRSRPVPWVATVRWWLILALAAGFALGGCAIPFGSGPESTDSTDQSAQDTRRDRNRLYLEEQERIERGRTFDRVGPSDR